MYDLNKSGTITKDEFQEILQMMIGATVSPDQVESIAERTMHEADHDGDGSISFAEFMNVRALPYPTRLSHRSFLFQAMEKTDIEQKMSFRFLT